MSIYSIKNHKELASLYFHDYEIQQIAVDYNQKEVQIHMKTPEMKDNHSKEFVLLFQGVCDIHIPMEEPWGSGIYLDSVAIEKVTDTHFRTSLLLNSGDVISCIAGIVTI